MSYNSPSRERLSEQSRSERIFNHSACTLGGTRRQSASGIMDADKMAEAPRRAQTALQPETRCCALSCGCSRALLGFRHSGQASSPFVHHKFRRYPFEIQGLELGGVFTAFTMETGWAFTFQMKSLRVGDAFQTFIFPWKTGLVMSGVFFTFTFTF